METIISDYLLFTIAVIWLIAASITDIKKREVANWLSFSLIAIALGIKGAVSIITLNYHPILYSFIGFVVFLVLANLLYYTKIFAGGDAKLLIALGTIFAIKPEFIPNYQYNIPFIIVFLLNILIIASIYGIIYSIGLALSNKKEFYKKFKTLDESTSNIRLIFLIVIAVSLLAVLIKGFYELLLLITLVFIFPYLYIFVKSVENACMIKLLSADKLTEGDWIVNSVKIGNKIIMPTADGLTLQDIDMIKSANKKILVKQGIPFVPVFLITLLITAFIGNLFIYMVSLFFGF